MISLALKNNIIDTYTNFNNFLVVQKYIFAPPHFICGIASATFGPPSLRHW
jgi:hypothetical protein